jgi:hypothetical protein
MLMLVVPMELCSALVFLVVPMELCFSVVFLLVSSFDFTKVPSARFKIIRGCA